MRLTGAWIWSLIGVSVAGCGEVSNAPADGSPPDARLRRCSPTAAFGTPVAMTALNTSSHDEAARLSPDELTVYFSSDRVGGVGSYDIWTSTRANISEPYGTPSLLAGVNTRGLERYPTVTADGLTLYAFVGADTDYDIVMATRADAMSSFGALSSITVLNSNVNDYTPYALPNGSGIYFASSRSSRSAPYRAARVATAFDAPTLVTGTNFEIANQNAMVLSPDERTLYFGSDRTGAGTYRIYEATRDFLAQGFNAPVLLDLDPTGQQYLVPSWISEDNCVLYFASRSVNGDYDIYTAMRGN